MTVQRKPRETVGDWSVSEIGSFYCKYRSQFVNHVSRLLGDASRSEEIVHDVLVKVLLAAPELPSEEHAKAYFHRALVNQVKDVLRATGRQPTLLLVDEFQGSLESSWVSELDHSEIISAAEDAAIVRRAISMLSSAERAALIMWDLEGRDSKDIARELGIKERTVRHTVSRARASLRRVLSEQIVDVERGLTALDLLSGVYRKTSEVVKKSSRIALSALVVLAGFLGYSQFEQVAVVKQVAPTLQERKDASTLSPNKDSVAEPDSSDAIDRSETVRGESSKGNEQTKTSILEKAMGYTSVLDDQGIPVSFSVIDHLGSVGTLFVGSNLNTRTENGVEISNIVSTLSGAGNVLISQTITMDAFGTSYSPEVQVGIGGFWKLLEITSVTSDIRRMPSGGYLLSVTMESGAAINPIVPISTGGLGLDLSNPPSQIATYLHLDASKTRILAQLVVLSESSQRNGA